MVQRSAAEKITSFAKYSFPDMLSHEAWKRRPFIPLARLTYLKFRQYFSNGSALVRLVGDIEVEVRSGETGLSGLYALGLHEFNEMMFTLHLLREGDTFIDVGANLGSYTLLAGKMTKCDVISVEPSPACVKRLKENCKRVGVNSRVINKAVTSRANRSRQQLYLSDSVSCENSVSETQGLGMKAVKNTTIDEILEGVRSVALMKMDIEGYERVALRGADEALRNKIGAIIIEDKSTETESILGSHGYVEVSYMPKRRILAFGKRINGERNSIWIKPEAIEGVSRRLQEARIEKLYFGEY